MPTRLKGTSLWCEVLVYVGRASASWLDCEVRSSRVLSRPLVYVGRANAMWLDCEVRSSRVLFYCMWEEPAPRGLIVR